MTAAVFVDFPSEMNKKIVVGCNSHTAAPAVATFALATFALWKSTPMTAGHVQTFKSSF